MFPAADVIKANTREIEPFSEAPAVGDWLVCSSGHVLAQYVQKPRTRLNDWGKMSGAVEDVAHGRRVISCAICGLVAYAEKQDFACHVVSDDAVKQAVALI